MRDDDKLIIYENKYKPQINEKNIIDTENSFKIDYLINEFIPKKRYNDDYFGRINPDKNLIYDNKSFKIKDIGIRDFSELDIDSHIIREPTFDNNKKLVINKGLSDSEIAKIIESLSQGKPLPPDLSSQVMSIQEFYETKAAIFEERSRETADTESELALLCTVLKFYKHQPILDVGCGIGRLMVPLAEHYGFEKIRGVDVSADLIKEGMRKYPTHAYRFMKASACKTPFPANSFAAVFMMWHVVVELSSIMDALFNELDRILIPGGIVIFDLPDVNSRYTKKHYSGERDKNGKNYQSYLERVPEFRAVENAIVNNGFSFPQIEKYRFGVDKYVFISKKLGRPLSSKFRAALNKLSFRF